jgi:hypothetical protein
MRSSKQFPLLAAALLVAGAAQAARLDMKDDRRAVAREDDVRIDAELLSDSVSPNSAVAITYQIENLSQSAVAVADKVVDLSYDADSATLILSVGAEVPTGASMPHLVIIAPGETRVLRAGAVPQVMTPRRDAPFISVPHYVQIKVNVLRNLAPFAKLIAQQQAGAAAVLLPDDGFERWVESNDAVLLNVLPVRWDSRGTLGSAEARE